ncbi:MAG: hypothetical protein LBH96_00805 [Candidatus Peribacteria bacterium]|jgi:D-alanine-D-alanine ligase-like ATP-grasp enzyme|nr:hypothetical protein [Candidatus Peribacteria bacterium]
MKQMLQIALITDQQSKEAQISEKSLQLIKQSLETLGHQWTHITRPSMRDEFLHSYENYDLAIPIIHGGIGEGGQIFALLEVLDIPYLFSDHTAHTLCFNKQRANVVVGEIGIQIPKSHYLSP